MGMMKKKKKKARPSKKTLKRPQRLLKAKDWIPTYTGKKIVRAYTTKFRTDLPTAIVELRMLGMAVSEVYEVAVKKTLADLAAQRRKKKEEEANIHLSGVEQDNTFAYIVGYTSGGAPYGTRWDELDEDERNLYLVNH